MVSPFAVAEEEGGAVPVRPVVIESAAHPDVSVSGRITRRYSIPLSFRVGGQIESRQIEVGDLVEKDQVLASLQTVDLNLAVVQRQADLEAARANARNAGRERRRLKNLYAKNLVSEQDLQRAETAEVSAKKTVLAAEAGLKLAQRQLQYSVLKAPQAGVLTEVVLETGQVVAAGQTVMQLAAGKREIEVFLPSRLMNRDYRSGRVQGVEQAFECDAILRAKTPFNDRQTLQYQAFYQLKNCRGERPPLGAVAHLHFKTVSQTELKRIPLSALVTDNGQGRVWVVRDGRVTSRPVTVERVDGRFAYVTSELKAGVRVVGRGAHRLVENQVVKVIGTQAR